MCTSFGIDFTVVDDDIAITVGLNGGDKSIVSSFHVQVTVTIDGNVAIDVKNAVVYAITTLFHNNLTIGNGEVAGSNSLQEGRSVWGAGDLTAIDDNRLVGELLHVLVHLLVDHAGGNLAGHVLGSGFDTGVLGKWTLVIGNVTSFVIIASVGRIDKLFPEQWEKSPYHVSNPVKWLLLGSAMCTQAIQTSMNLKGLSMGIIMLNVIALVSFGGFATYMYKSGKVHMNPSYELV